MSEIPQEQIPAVEQDTHVVKSVRKSRLKLWLALVATLLPFSVAGGYVTYSDFKRQAEYEDVDFNKAIKGLIKPKLDSDSEQPAEQKNTPKSSPSDKNDKKEEKTGPKYENKPNNNECDEQSVALA